MKRLISLVFLCLWSGFAQASPVCAKSETSCVLDAAWGAALLLPEEKQARVQPLFLDIAGLSGDMELYSKWEDRFQLVLSPANQIQDYGWTKAEPILKEGGLEALIERARARQAPLHFGRADVLLSAGKRLYDEEPEQAKHLNTVLLDLAQTASDFEASSLAHAAAELAMVRCDLELLEQSIGRTDAPNNLRYAFWRARIVGDSLALLPRVRAIDSDEDTREVRRVLDGYRAILEFGYCTAAEDPLGS